MFAARFSFTLVQVRHFVYAIHGTLAGAPQSLRGAAVTTEYVFTKEEAPADERAARTTGAPYMSYKGFTGYLDKFHSSGLPSRFDTSYFNGASGSLISQTRATLAYFELTDIGRVPTPTMHALAAADEAERKKLLSELFHEKYADALALGRNATMGQLGEVFKARGLSGATISKAITFYLQMAQDLGFELSPHYKVRAASASGTSKRRRGAASATKAAEQIVPPASATPPVQQPVTLEAQKAAYVTMLMDLATKQDGGSDAGQLLDRIERALGIGDSAATAAQTSPSAADG